MAKKVKQRTGMSKAANKSEPQYKPISALAGHTKSGDHYLQTVYTAPICRAISNIKDKIFAGEIAEQLEDEELTKNIEAVQVSKSTIHKSLGRNKSGCLWKKVGNTKSNSTSVSLVRKKWDKKVEEREKAKTLKARMAEIKAEEADRVKSQRKRTKERQERKKVNEFKSAKYQIIKSLASTKKWHKKAKRTLTQLPAEIFYKKFK